MYINDRVYGENNITEEILIELINSKPVQRLKGINQAGASQYAIEGKTVTRYEHSIGVMLLLKKLGASLEEQIGGLLHDIPHTAFSHVIDFVFKSDNHEFHEKFYEKIILNSDIPQIIEKKNYNVQTFLEEGNFPLLERPLPALCADRLDYSFRDMTVKYGFNEKIANYINKLTVVNNEIMFKDKITAKEFGEDYIKMDEEVWAAPVEIALFQILADAVKKGLEEKIISEDDLFMDDDFVYKKLKNSENKYIQSKLKLLSPGFSIKDDPDDYDFYSKTKLRYVDPKIGEDNKIFRVTEAFPEFINTIEKHKEFINRGNFIKII